MLMPDIQKIILGMECCVSPQIRCRECPYRPEGAMCDKAMMTDALKILRGLLPVKPFRLHHTDKKSIDDYKCVACGADVYYGQKYCADCGRAVNWDE